MPTGLVSASPQRGAREPAQPANWTFCRIGEVAPTKGPYRMAADVTLDAIVTYATRLRREVGESLVGACVRREPALQRSPAFIRWAAAKTQ